MFELKFDCWLYWSHHSRQPTKISCKIFFLKTVNVKSRTLRYKKKCKSKPSNTVQNKKAPSQCALKVWLNVGGEPFFGTYLEKLLPVKWLIGVDVLKVVENVHLAKWMFSLLDNMKLCSCARPNDGMKKSVFHDQLFKSKTAPYYSPY